MAIYRVPTGVTHELIEGEVVVVNLNSGRYFSLQGSAAGAWQALSSGACSERVKAALNETSQAVYQNALALFEKEEILQAQAGSDDSGVELLPVMDQEFKYEIFNDLEDMLLLDPVHEVDEKGWPVEAGA